MRPLVRGANAPLFKCPNPLRVEALPGLAQQQRDHFWKYRCQLLTRVTGTISTFCSDWQISWAQTQIIWHPTRPVNVTFYSRLPFDLVTFLHCWRSKKVKRLFFLSSAQCSVRQLHFVLSVFRKCDFWSDLQESGGLSRACAFFFSSQHHGQLLARGSAARGPNFRQRRSPPSFIHAAPL